MESNIYSFGIIALELASGRKPINHEILKDQVDSKTISIQKIDYVLYLIGRYGIDTDLYLILNF